MGLTTIGTPALWLGFGLVVTALLALDLGVFHRRAHDVSLREATIWSLVWIGVSLLFSLGIYLWCRPLHGSRPALEFLTGYLIEKALSVDNLFVFLVVLQYFAVPAPLQHRVLFYGILAALILRGTFIVAGAALTQAFHSVMYVFGAFLIWTGVKLFFEKRTEVHPERNPVLGWVRRLVPLVSDYRGQRFFAREGGRWYATPLLVVLVVIESSDIMFALDSIPAIFGVTTDTFIVYTSNIFAILGLRALFFLTSRLMSKICYLRLGLGLVLTFMGVKMLIGDFFNIPIGTSLGVVAGLTGLSVVVSLGRAAAGRAYGRLPCGCGGNT